MPQLNKRKTGGAGVLLQKVSQKPGGVAACQFDLYSNRDKRDRAKRQGPACLDTWGAQRQIQADKDNRRIFLESARHARRLSSA